MAPCELAIAVNEPASAGQVQILCLSGDGGHGRRRLLAEQCRISLCSFAGKHVDRDRGEFEGSVNLTEPDWGSTEFVHSWWDSVGGKPAQAAGAPVTSFQVANRPVISER